MGKITVRRSDGEIIKVDEKKLKGDMKKIREQEKRKIRRASGKRPRRSAPSGSSRPSGSSSAGGPRNAAASQYDSAPGGSPRQQRRPANGARRRRKRRVRRGPGGRGPVNTWQKVVVGVLVGLMVLGIGAVGYVRHEVNVVFSKMNTVDFPTSREALGISDYNKKYYRKENKYIKNYAVFGVDSRSANESGRTDSLMIVSVNTKTGQINLTSILRDTYIKIAKVEDGQDYGYDKINAAHSFGGPIMTVKTLNENFDMNITDFVEVNFKAVADIVDAMGGIELDIKEDEIQNLNKFIRENNRLLKGKKSPELTKAGKQKLDGKQALSYCRIRYAGNGDYQRTARQRIVLSTIYKDLKASPLKTQKEAMEAALPYITTSLSSGDMWPILKAYRKSEKGPISKSMTNEKIVKSGTINGGWCLIFDTLEANVKYLHKIIYANDYEVSDVVKKRNKDYKNKTMYVTKYAINSKVYNK